jgi:hypothetical protein
MPLYCPQCGSSTLRTSRFRPDDLGRLILFQLPVRCIRCKERRFVSMGAYLKVRRERHSHPSR